MRLGRYDGVNRDVCEIACAQTASTDVPQTSHVRDPVNCFRHITGGKGVPAIAVCPAFPFRFALYSVMLAKPALRHVILASVPTLMARDLIVWALFFALPRHLI